MSTVADFQDEIRHAVELTMSPCGDGQRLHPQTQLTIFSGYLEECLRRVDPVLADLVKLVGKYDNFNPAPAKLSRLAQ